jgi:hypothetical protein
MAAPRDVMRETQEFEAMRDALRRAITPDGETPTNGAAKPPRGRRRPKLRRR